MSKWLSTDDIFRVRGEKIQKPVYEPKRNEPSAEQDAYLLAKYQEIERVLGQQRVLPYSKSSVGHFKDGQVTLERKAGNWDKFGFVQNGVTCVPLHEAMFLVESKRLLVFRNQVVMSVEECYKSFLTEDDLPDANRRLSLAEYLVYALMVRNQSVVRIHNEVIIVKEREPEIENEEELIWSHLEDLLTRREGNSSSALRDKIKERMKKTKEFIESQYHPDEGGSGEMDIESPFEWPRKAPKRKQSNAWHTPAKRFKEESQSRSRDLDKLKTDSEYVAMRTIFEELQLIQVNPCPIEVDFKSTFSIRFDISMSGKKNKTLSYRGIVCTKDSTPNYKDLVYLHRKQSVPLPIIVFNVDESMVVNCFLYAFRGE